MFITVCLFLSAWGGVNLPPALLVVSLIRWDKNIFLPKFVINIQCSVMDIRQLIGRYGPVITSYSVPQAITSEDVLLVEQNNLQLLASSRFYGRS